MCQVLTISVWLMLLNYYCCKIYLFVVWITRSIILQTSCHRETLFSLTSFRNSHALFPALLLVDDASANELVFTTKRVYITKNKWLPWLQTNW